MSQKGFTPILLVLFILIVVAAIGGTYFLSRQTINMPAESPKNKQSEDSPKQFPSPITTMLPSVTPVTTSSTVPNNHQESEDFPFYPNSKLVKKESSKEACVREKDGNSLCSLTILSYETPDDYNKVNEWFLGVEKNTKWNCDGGFGEYSSPRDASNERQCEKGTLKYLLGIQAEGNSTEIIVNIPNI